MPMHVKAQLNPGLVSLHTYVRGEGTSVSIETPMVTDKCGSCGQDVDLTVHDYTAVRVDGDSANGFEPWCASCDRGTYLFTSVMR